MPRTHVVVRKSPGAVPSAVVPVAGLASPIGLGTISRVASSRRLPVGVSSTVAAGTAITLPSDQAPVWQNIPTVTFTLGVSSFYDLTPLLSDPDTPLSLVTITKNAQALPLGVTLDAPLKRYVYDHTVGTSAAGTNGHILTADDAQVQSGTLTGLDFATNAGAQSNANSVRFKWTGSALVPIYGTSGNGVTYIWKYRPAQQNGYYSTFFWGNDDGQGNLNTFLWNGGNSNSYYGFHPYPNPPPNGSAHLWEVSVESNDFTGAAVTKGVWYPQGARIRGANGAVKEHEFYFNLPNTDAANRIFRTTGTTWGNTMPPSPALTWGDAPWNPSMERGAGVHRGIIIFNAYLPTSEMIQFSACETDAQVLSLASSLGRMGALWYLNMNPTPTDISDKSGAGHHPAWWNSNRPALYSSGTADVTSFTLTSSASGTATLPFTIGHAFKQGDIPSGQFIVSDLSTFQANVRNRWPDGSVKYAILSGRKALTNGVASAVAVRKQGNDPGGTNIPESTLISLNPTVSMALSGFGTVTLSTLFGSPVRSFLGPQMSEFHYRSAVGSDAHLAVWFYVRVYQGNAIEIETCVENGYMKVAGPVNKAYTATLTINGTTRYSAALTHWPRTRWFTVNWYDGTSGLTDFARVIPAHDANYMRLTKVVPNYATTAASTSTYLNGLPQSITPLGNGSMPGGSLSAGGSAPHIGILPQWAATYFVNSDSRAYRGTIVNAYCSNSWPVCYRDESTQRPLALTTRPNLDAAGWGIDPVVAGTGSNSNSFGSGTQAHMPEAGYSAYLLTGRWSFIETAAFWAARSHMENNPTTRGLTSGNGGSATTMTAEDRGKSWHLRTAHQLVSIYPDSGLPSADAQVKADWLAALGATWTRYTTTTLDCPLGYMSQHFNPGSYSPDQVTLPDLGVPCFMGNFHAQCVGYTWDLDILTGSNRTAHTTCRDHFYKFPVGLCGDNTGWCFRACAQFVVAIGTYNGSTITWDATWAAAYARSDSTGPADIIPASSKPCTAGGTIETGHWPDATSYGGNLHPAIAYAVEHGATGAAAAYARIQAASNYAAFVADQVNATQWAIVPRT